MMGLIEKLNEPQTDAVNTLDGPLLVLAGAGSGKTRVVTFRIANLLEHGVPSSKILGLTFTNKAAGEMKERIKKLTNSDVLICTFHSLGARILRESISHLGYSNNFTIYDEEDALKLIAVCLKDLNISDKKYEPKGIKGLISRAKNDLKGASDIVHSDYEDASLFPEIYSLYQKRLKEYNATDFDDLLFLTVRLLREVPQILEYYQNRWSHLLIDEYQDTNMAQYEIVQQLVAKSHNLCVVGDPDQSIYSWRGANIKNILNFESDYPQAKVVRLEQNYRSRSNILEAANRLINFNYNRYEKVLWSNLGEGEKIKHHTADSEKDEARFVSDQIRYYHEVHGISYQDMVIFYRTNFQSRVFEDRFLSTRIPYIIVGGISFYQRREIKDILAYLRMVHSGSDYVSFARTINLPKRGIGSTTMEKIRAGAIEENVPIISYCEALVDGVSLIKLSAKQMEGIKDYVRIIRELRKISEACSLKELVKVAIAESGYMGHLMEDQETFDDRKGNLDELVGKAMEWEMSTENPTLSGFLEELSLKSTLDETNESDERVNLMTIHNGKGLEFTLVFLAGLEEDLFPPANSRENDEAVEEERRVCYVGMTRAKEYLYLTESRLRFLWGTTRAQRPSRFLKEVPQEFIEKVRRSTSMW
jgi:DNA helicase-2/ATP-dependent DNA helicase PcrA